MIICSTKMLEGILYTLIEKSENGAKVKLLPESPIYAAHFPGYPITPGVTLVQMALECMGMKMTGAKDIKFLIPVIPTAEGLVLTYEWEVADDGNASIQAFLPSGELCAKMSVTVA